MCVCVCMTVCLFCVLFIGSGNTWHQVYTYTCTCTGSSRFSRDNGPVGGHVLNKCTRTSLLHHVHIHVL